MIRLETHGQRIVFDRWPRARTGSEPWQNSGDVPHYVELERPCDLAPGRHTLRVLMDDTILVATLDDAVALSTRIYNRPSGHLGLFTSDGSIAFSTPTVRTRTSSPAHSNSSTGPERARMPTGD